MGDTNQTPPVYFEGSAAILGVEDMAANLWFYVNLLGFQNARWGNSLTCHATGPAFTSAGAVRAAAELGSGSMWKAPKSSTRNTKRRSEDSSSANQLLLGLEMHVEDPDENVLRLGSEPKPASS
jgi:catechol 2,3-dioxygenase-like lactoylglutathione lyase family enzyme